MNMHSILKYDTNRINAQCNSSTKKNMEQKIFENVSVRDYPNLLKNEIFFHCFFHISSQTHIVTSQSLVGLHIASLVYFLSQ